MTISTPRSTALLLALSLLLGIPQSMGDEASMLQTLASWNKSLHDYQTALERTQDPEQRESLLRTPPTGRMVAKDLWQSISKRTGTRLIPAPKGSKRPDRRVPTYEYEQPWAAPAVIWWLQHSNLLQHVVKKGSVDATLKSLLNSAERIHYAHRDMAQLCPVLAQSTSARSYELLETIFNKNPNAAARANAALAMSLLLRHENVYSIEGTAEKALAKRLAYLRYALQHAPAGSYFGRLRLEDVAMEEIYLLRHLSPDCIPPQIFPTNSMDKMQALPVVGEAQLLYFWAPEDPASIALLRTAATLKSQYPYLRFRAITAGISHDAIRNHPDMALPEVEHFIDAEGKAIKAYRVPKAGYAALISDKAKLLYLGEPNLKLQAAINAYDAQRARAASRPASPDAHHGTSPASSDQAPPPLKELPPLGF